MHALSTRLGVGKMPIRTSQLAISIGSLQVIFFYKIRLAIPFGMHFIEEVVQLLQKKNEWLDTVAP